MNRRSWNRRAVFAAAITLLATSSLSRWMTPHEVPIERLLPQLERRVERSPDDAHARYLLGRVHGAAVARGLASVRMYEDKLETEGGELYRKRTNEGCGPIASTAFQRNSQVDKKLPKLSREDRCAHLTESLRHLSRAVEFAPKDALYQLGLACAFDSGASLAVHVDASVIAASIVGNLSAEETKLAIADLEALDSPDAKVRDAAEKKLAALGVRATRFLSAHRDEASATRHAIVARLLESVWHDLAIEHYESAYLLAFDVNRRHATLLEDLVPDLASYEAAQSYIRLVESRGARDGFETNRLAQIKAGLAKLKAIPTEMTPILVPDEASATLDSLFDGARARFDLAGIGEQQTWPWPRADASFLVWDPDCTGAITSGRQLFGSATWWMFFEDGYAALDALDESGDGWLAGAELESLALWRDANRNGTSDAGEIESLAQRGVLAIATRADGLDGLSPMRSNGVVLTDGRTLPTFDWIAAPLPGP